MRAGIAALRPRLDAGGRTLSVFLGIVVLGLLTAALATPLGAADIMRWAREVFGITFLIALAGLVITALHCWMRLADEDGASDQARLETGLQAANGIATLALTYTLLGISLGIGSLAGHELGPDTIQAVIRDLTRHFSMAFLTTVVGLPTSAVLRAMLMIRARRIAARAIVLTPLHTGDPS
jgi:hypothetical protein